MAKVWVEDGKLKTLLEALRSRSGADIVIRRVGLPQETALSPHDIEEWRRAGLEVRTLGILDEAEHFASGLTSGLQCYYNLLTEHPDSRVQAAYIGERKSTQLYVWPDVIKRERVKPAPSSQSPERDSSPEKRSRKGSTERFSAESLDIGEETPFGCEPPEEEIEKRVPWKGDAPLFQSWDGIRSRGELHELKEAKPDKRFCVILGPPGQGKTELVEMTVRALAAEVAQCIQAQRAGVDALPLLFRLRCGDLAMAAVEVGERTVVKNKVWRDDPWKNALASILRAQTAKSKDQAGNLVTDETVEYLVQHAHEPRAWLFLDALDEVEDRDNLLQWFQELTSWECRVIVTSRPYGYSNWSISTGVLEYRLAPFSVGQSLQFIAKWYGDQNPEARGRLEDQIG